jgi:hypothetical protein
MKLVLIVVLKMFLKVDQQNKNENYPDAETTTEQQKQINLERNCLKRGYKTRQHN